MNSQKLIKLCVFKLQVISKYIFGILKLRLIIYIGIIYSIILCLGGEMAKVYIPPQAQIAAILTEDGKVKYIYVYIYMYKHEKWKIPGQGS